MRFIRYFLSLSCSLLTFSVCAASEIITVEMNNVSGGLIGESVGTVTIKQVEDGLEFTPNLHGLTYLGVNADHGFHVHTNHSCTDAGGHYDPQETHSHKGPSDPTGHLGDLPSLYVTNDGTATQSVNAQRLTLADVKGHSLMIHEGGDNYSDTPEANGGGGNRMACGLIG